MKKRSVRQKGGNNCIMLRELWKWKYIKHRKVGVNLEEKLHFCSHNFWQRLYFSWVCLSYSKSDLLWKKTFLFILLIIVISQLLYSHSVARVRKEKAGTATQPFHSWGIVVSKGREDNPNWQLAFIASFEAVTNWSVFAALCRLDMVRFYNKMLWCTYSTNPKYMFHT